MNTNRKYKSSRKLNNTPLSDNWLKEEIKKINVKIPRIK